MAPAPRLVLHATSVAVEGRALVILGPSGAGKSALALQLMSLGAGLIADDRTDVVLAGGRPVATCPPAIRGRIEARGIGILAAAAAPPAPVALVADLGRVETERLPPTRSFDLLGCAVPLIFGSDAPHFAPAILLWLKGGGAE